MNSLQEVSSKWQELKSSFLEMSRIKSDFDILKFTLDKEWPFIAHQWHFIAKQYMICLSEIKKEYIEIERQKRKITRLNKSKSKDYDLDILDSENIIDSSEYRLRDLIARAERYEQVRQYLTKKNWWPIKDHQYQKEEPLYWEWNLANQAKQKLISRQTGLSKWVVNAIDMSSRENDFFPEYKTRSFIKNWTQIDWNTINEMAKLDNKISYLEKEKFYLLPFESNQDNKDKNKPNKITNKNNKN